MVRFPLAGLTIAVTGDFGPRRTHETLKRWVEKNGGHWATKISKDVTHLISTKEDYRNKAPMVKMALKLKLFTIMTFDWLEDSLMKGFRLAPRGDYLVARAIKDAKKVKRVRKQTKKETIKRGIDSFEKECQDIQAQLFSGTASALPYPYVTSHYPSTHTKLTPLVPMSSPDRYHIYRDSTLFAYDISLVRVNLQQNKSERYVLRLCTTHSAPHSFATLLTYHHTHGAAQKSILAPMGSDWGTAFGAFTAAFRAKTKVEWDERFAAVPFRKGGGEDAFVYAVPKEGEPRGEVVGDFEVGG